MILQAVVLVYILVHRLNLVGLGSPELLYNSRYNDWHGRLEKGKG